MRSGLAWGLVAYVWWGLIPIYFAQVKRVNPNEILAHRIVWATLMLVGWAVASGNAGALWRKLTTRRVFVTMTASSLLLAFNWLLYIHAAVGGHLVDASLGYYMLPLVNAFFATVFLGERLRPLHYPALALVLLAIVVPMAALGVLPWIALGLSISFGLYGLVRKVAAINALDGLTLETVILAPLAGGYLLIASQAGTASYGGDGYETLMLSFGGIVTIVPLLAFGLALRRLPLLALNMIQVISPTLQMVIALYRDGEALPWPMAVALGCVWAGVGLFIFDEVRRRRAGSAPGEPRGVSPRIQSGADQQPLRLTAEPTGRVSGG